MDFRMSAARCCVYLFNYDSLIITILNGAKNRAFPPSFSAVTYVDSGRHSHAPLYISYGRTG